MIKAGMEKALAQLPEAMQALIRRSWKSNPQLEHAHHARWWAEQTKAQ